VAFDELMGLTNRLLADAQALAAVAARLRLEDLDDDADPAVREQLDRVVDALGMREQVDGLEPGERAVLVAFARSYLAQAVDLLENPTRPSSWSHSDPVVLQAQGAASGVVASLFETIGVGRPGARILDVGTGVAGLATALCRTFPDSTVVGVDPWQPALELARANVAEAGLDDRITLVHGTIQEYEDADGFDLAWLPSFFIPETVLDDALARLLGLLRPGGVLVVGVVMTDGSDPLAAAADDLFTVRSGGSLLSADDASGRLERAGFRDVREIERTWNPPLRFVVGSRT
jgi:SAM-dependent methyltransferase